MKKAEHVVRNKRGAVTVEAVLVLPVYTLAVLFMIHFLNVSYLQLTIQQGLNNAGRTLAQYCYAVDMTMGLETINTNILDSKAETVKPVVENFNTVTAGIGDLFNDFSVEKLGTMVEQGKEFASSVKTMASSLNGIGGKDIVSYLLTTAAEGGTSLIVESIVEEYLTEMKVNRNMLDGKISYRVCMDDKTNDIILIATYRYHSGMFSMFTDGFDMRQVVAVHPWVGGATKGVRQK